MKPSATPRRRGRVLAAVFVLAVGTTRAADAEILRVPDAYPTINAALAAAVPHEDEIWVSETGSPYREAIALVDGVSCHGGWDASYATQDPARTVLELPPATSGSVVGIGAVGPEVVFSGFTVQGGSTVNGGGIFCGGGAQVTIRDCVIRNNFASGSGGGIQIAAGASPHVVDCVFENNVASRRGGGIAVATGSDGTWIEHCTVRACSTTAPAIDGGGGGIFTASGIRLERTTFRENVSARNGGGLFVREASIRAWGNLFYENVAAFGGGGIHHEGGAGFHSGTLVEGCLAGTNALGGNGGGVHFDGGTNRFDSGFVRYNRVVNGDGGGAGLGGGFYFSATEFGSALRRTEIVQNRAYFGGGVAVQGTLPRAFSFAEIESNSIVANTIDAPQTAEGNGGGGIHIQGQFVGTISNNIVAFQEKGYAIACSGVDASPALRFNCVFNDSDNPVEEYGLDCQDRTGLNGNIRANPRLCCGPRCQNGGPPAPDLQLDGFSPCLGAGEGGIDLGAHQGFSDCLNPVSVQPRTWGEIKALYR